MITRGLAALAIGATVALTAGCGSSGTGASSDPTFTPVTSVSFQLRPVLSEVAAKGNDCDLPIVAVPPLIKPIPKICKSDESALYSLAKAVVGQNQVKAVAMVADGTSSPDTAVSLSLDTPGTTAFASLTGEVSAKSSPRNQFAIVVDGKVVSSPEVAADTGPITGGVVQASFATADEAKAFYESWPESLRTAAK